MDHLRRTPSESKAAVALAVLALLGIISFSSRSSINGVVECSRTEVGAFLFGAAAIVAGLYAVFVCFRDRKAASQPTPLNAAKWALRSETFNLALVMAAVGIGVGIYRVLWAISVANDCTGI